MKSTLSPKSLLLLLFLIIFSSFSSTVANCQNIKFSGKEMAAISEEINTINAKLEKSFKTEPALYERMKNDLRKAYDTKDHAKQIDLLLSYKKKYSQQYSKMLIKSGIDLDAVIASFNKKYPKFNFQKSNTYGIALSYRNNSKFTYKKGNWRLPSNSNKKITDFLEESRTECSMIGGSQVTFGNKSIDAFAGSTIAGLCFSEGTLTATIEMPPLAKTKTLRIDGLLESYPSAMGIAGVASCFAGSFVSVNSNDESILFESAMDLVIAMVLWWVDIDLTKEFSHTLDVSNFSEITITGHSFVDVSALVGGAARGNGRMKLTTSELKYAW